MSALDQTMGALLMGVISAGILYGVSCSQLYYYYTRYPKDPFGMKLLVAAIWVSDTCHQAFISQCVYRYLVTEYGNPAALMIPNKAIIIQVFFNAFTGLFVQSFFTYRVWKLSNRNFYLVVSVAVPVVAEFAVSMAYTVRAFSLTSYLELDRIKGLSICMNVFAAVADVAIAGILCAILQMSKTEFARSKTLLNKLIVFAVNTGLLTSICACISLITFFALPDTFVFITFYFLIGRLYSNSLMATLNARKSLQAHSSGEVSVSLRDMQSGSGGTTPYNLSQRRGNGFAIRIDTTEDLQHGADLDSQKIGNLDKSPVHV